jgi:hypothetical protein
MGNGGVASAREEAECESPPVYPPTYLPQAQGGWDLLSSSTFGIDYGGIVHGSSRVSPCFVGRGVPRPLYGLLAYINQYMCMYTCRLGEALYLLKDMLDLFEQHKSGKLHQARAAASTLHLRWYWKRIFARRLCDWPGKGRKRHGGFEALRDVRETSQGSRGGEAQGRIIGHVTRCLGPCGGAPNDSWTVQLTALIVAGQDACHLPRPQGAMFGLTNFTMLPDGEAFE